VSDGVPRALRGQSPLHPPPPITPTRPIHPRLSAAALHPVYSHRTRRVRQNFDESINSSTDHYLSLCIRDYPSIGGVSRTSSMTSSITGRSQYIAIRRRASDRLGRQVRVAALHRPARSRPACPAYIRRTALDLFIVGRCRHSNSLGSSFAPIFLIVTRSTRSTESFRSAYGRMCHRRHRHGKSRNVLRPTEKLPCCPDGSLY